MICKNCGKELPEGTKFCTGCGIPVEAAAETAETPAPPAAPVPPAAPAPSPVSVPVTPPPAVEDQAPASSGTAVLTGKNRGGKTLVILGVAAAAVVILVVLLLKMLLGGGGGKAVYVYANEDDELMFLKALKEGAETVELNDDPTLGVRFSKDGKYLFFFANKDGGGSGSSSSSYYSPTADLYRMEVSKIGKKGEEPEKISSDVEYYNTTVLNNGNVLYIRDGQLRFFDGKDSQKLASDVESFIVNEGQTYAYYTETDSSDYTQTLYRVEIKADGEKEKLVSGADAIWSDWDDDVIVYGVSNEDETYDVYSVAPGGDKNRLARDVASVLAPESKDGKAAFYYLTRQTETYTLYDFVNDSLEAADNEAVNNPQWPKYEDYRSPGPNGYDVTDYNAYNAAYNAVRDAYNAARNRNSMRDYLRNNSYEQTSYTLLRYENGEEKELAKDLDTYPIAEGAVAVYSRRDQEVSKVAKIEDLEYGGQIYDFIGQSDREWFQNVNGTESALKIDDDMIPSGLYMLGDSELIIWANSADYEDSALLAYSVGKDALTFTATVTDDEFTSVEVGETKGGKDALYYFEEMNKDGSAGDLVRYAGGEKVTLAKEANRVVILDDGSAIFKTDDNKYNEKISASEYSLYVVADGKDSRIADEVRAFIPMGAKQVLYISDGDLYVWNGSESTRIAQEVVGVWSSERADYTSYYPW